MKLVRFSSPNGREVFGVYSDGMASDLSSSYSSFSEMLGDLDNLRSRPPENSSEVDGAEILPPADRGSKILCMAVNYHSHLQEMKSEQTKEPVLFTKFYASLTGPYSPIRRFTHSEIMDYEGEIAVVIGKRAHNVVSKDAWKHIAGYVLLNDVSARSLFRVPQGTGVMLDWFSCKANDRATPLGPWVVTPDEAGEFSKLRIETFLNGARVQSQNVSDMVFDVPKIIEHVTSRITLEPGDIISTGTPSGVGVARNRTMRQGDLVRVQADGIGYLENRII
ncbi:MAG TPA: fumarylacetoacetate hydrolase family protein [Nitrososphaerales archaeon]|nr:fumarylacetoacetate hydrolase family protein [Nitrososphaerales archaeon]